MRHRAIIPTIAILPAILIGASQSARAQQNNAPTANQPDRLVSHQINQPAPDTVNRYKMSKDRLDEIRDLCFTAEQELKEKNLKK